MTNTNKPLHKFRYGNVSASIWVNEDKQGNTYLSVAIDKTYRNREGVYQSTNRFTLTDLLALSKIADDAFVYGRRCYDETNLNEPETDSLQGTAV